MPNRQLPPLTGLKAFEAAGRHLSFTQAADELGVTQAAVSHQIKTLEAHLNLRLFHRQTRKLRLTNAGERLLETTTAALDRIQKTVNDIKNVAKVASLAIRVPPTFAAKWLLPRLHQFRERNPDIELAINHSNEVVKFADEPLDLAVTYGNGHWPGVNSHKVFNLDFFPVCAADLITPATPLNDLSDLRNFDLLHDANFDNWTAWIRQANLQNFNARTGTILDDTNVLIQAAIDGQGIAMCSSIFVSEHLADGRLVKPFDLVLEIDSAYYLVYPEAHLQRDRVVAFRDWILSY